MVFDMIANYRVNLGISNWRQNGLWVNQRGVEILGLGTAIQTEISVEIVKKGYGQT